MHFHYFAAGGYQKGDQKARSFENILFTYFHFPTHFFRAHIKVFSIFDTGMSRQYQENQLEIIAQPSWTEKVFKNCQNLKKNRSPKFD